MSCAAMKALLIRYMYMLSHRDQWLPRVFSVVFPIIFVLEALWLESSFRYKEFHQDIVRHDEETITVIPWPMEIVVCPDGSKERQLMANVQKILRLQNQPIGDPVKIIYVQTADQMVGHLARWRSTDLASSSRGVHFHEITDTKLVYTVRPQTPNDTRFLDWGAYRTTERFPSPMNRGPREDEYFDVYMNGKVFSPGIIQLQVAIDKAYIQIHIPNVTTKWLLLSFPYPVYSDWDLNAPINVLGFTFSLTTFMLIIVTFVVVYGVMMIISVLCANVIRDKVSGIRELLSINGTPRWMANASWVPPAVVETMILAIVDMLILKNLSSLQYMTRQVLIIVIIALNMSSIFWACFISSIFTSERLSGILIIFWGILSPLIYQFIPPGRFILQGCLAILPNAGFVLIFKAFQEFDGAETELGLDRLFSPPIHYLPVGTILLIMLAKLIILHILTFYVDLVKPGPFGRALPWYMFTRKQKSRTWPVEDPAAHDSTYFEDFDSKDPIALECVNLYKFFGQYKAVDNVNMKILKNRITVLLGHNGAGKSTLFSILCGMYSPTKGDFYTEHYNVFTEKNIKRFRKSLGYCPQNNLLMDELTVNQHLVVFGLLKGLSGEEALEYSNKWTKLFDMEDMQNTKAKKLSAGTKRKLSLAIAMVSGPEYLLLDEPSSGLDAESMRKFWNIMLQEKGKHTVVLSTHNMDEAEIIGDRIAFMGSGQLKAYGTTSFLKRKLDIRYKLICATGEEELENLIKTVIKIVPSASIVHQTNRTVTFGLPSDQSKEIPNLMKRLDSQFTEKVALTLLQSTMDDVFIKFFEKAKTINLEGIITKESEIDRPRYFTFGQMKELFKKRIKWLLYRRLIAMIIIFLVVPGLAMVSTMYFVNKVSELKTFDSPEILELTLDKYSGSSSFISRNSSDLVSALKLAMRNSGINYEEVDQTIIQALQEKAEKDLFDYRSKVVFAFETRYIEPIAYYSRNAFHAAPIAYSAMINALLQGKATIVTRSFPFTQESEACYPSEQISTAVYIMAYVLTLMILLTSSYFAIFPREEHHSNFKHLQLMTGLLPATYWISNLIFDMAFFSLSCILMLAIMAIMDNNLFLNETVMSALVVVFILYGISQIPLEYVLSRFKTLQTQNTAMYIYICIPLSVLLIILALLGVFVGIQVAYFLPPFILYRSLLKIFNWAVMRRKCYVCKNYIECAILIENTLFSQLKTELISFASISLVYIAVTLALDHGLASKLWAIIKQGLYKNIDDTKGEIDPEVVKEKQRVRDLETDGTLEQPELVCDGLGKKYSRKLVAVRDVTFATELGELFGLLGANGAGKSTTFDMLSGLTSPTRGDACIRGQWRLGDCEYKYIRNIGYCPQVEGLLPGLSGRATLRLFGRLRWVKLDVLDYHVEQWLEALDMTSLADRPCEQYSGGNKKKLSFAASMIGNPSIALLDEPTTGIDPVIRRRIWEILMASLKERKQAIVLASHAMSECEAICDRLTILVKGEMKCLGSVPKLKNTFGKSCILRVKLRQNTTPEESETIESKILSQFSGHIDLQEKLLQLLTFNVKTEKYKIYEVFAAMLKIKEGNSAIDDFSLAETPLEDIFLMLAQNK